MRRETLKVQPPRPFCGLGMGCRSITWLITVALFLIVLAKVDWLHFLDRKVAKTA